MKNVHIFGGGTIFHVRNHLALAAPAYGTTARHLFTLCIEEFFDKMRTRLHLSKMATAVGRGTFETYDELRDVLTDVVADPDTKIIFFNAAVVDFQGQIGDVPSGKYADRLKTAQGNTAIEIAPLPKLLSAIRKHRKDIFLVAFKTTCNATPEEQYLAGLNLLKKNSVNLVLANDTATRTNMIITPEEATYCVTKDRDACLKELVAMTKARSMLTFTQSTVVSGDPVPWQSEEIPSSLRTVVDHLIERGAYKPFNGATVGHFACKLDDQTFLTSMRKTNFNDLPKLGLVRVKTDGPDTVLAYGAKPSVGGQSQRIIFKDHPGFDCVVHAHVEIKADSKVPIRSQREVECGSHQCGRNTSDGLHQFGNLKAVHLDKHGPNIIFNSGIDPMEVINFIEANFDLSTKTGGFQLT